MRLPDISLHDRLLDFMLIEAVEVQQLREIVQRLLDAIILAPGPANPPNPATSATQPPGSPVAHLPGVRRFRARAAIIETSDAVDVTLDGEIRTHTPALVRVGPQRLRVLASPHAKTLLAPGTPDVPQ